MSIDDDRMKRTKRLIADENLKRDSKGKAAKYEDLQRNYNSLAFSATLGWEWYNPTGVEKDRNYEPEAMPDYKGQVLEYNQANFLMLAKEFPQFINQIKEEIDDEKSFFDDSKRS